MPIRTLPFNNMSMTGQSVYNVVPDSRNLFLAPDGIFIHVRANDQVIVTIKKKSGQSQNLKELMHRESPSIIRKCLGEYLRCLKEGEETYRNKLSVYPRVVVVEYWSAM